MGQVEQLGMCEIVAGVPSLKWASLECGCSR